LRTEDISGGNSKLLPHYRDLYNCTFKCTVRMSTRENIGERMRQTKELTISEARERLTSLPEELDRHPGAVAVTRRGKPVLAVLPWDVYESIVETLEIMGDDDLMADLRRAIQEISAGEAVDWELALKEL
jgi:antitoxin YefM